jgi:hypothetical protein
VKVCAVKKLSRAANHGVSLISKLLFSTLKIFGAAARAKFPGGPEG